MISKLSVAEIPSNDCKYLRLVDNSYYNPAIDPTNEILEITPPGYDCAVIFNVDHHFNSVFNSITLKTYTAKLVDLPDGVYHIKYSINPNEAIFAEMDMFRVCLLMSKYSKAICELFTKRCAITHKKFEEYRKQLIWIKELIDASKYLVEECCEIKAGIELYNEASTLLDELNSCLCGKLN